MALLPLRRLPRYFLPAIFAAIQRHVAAATPKRAARYELRTRHDTCRHDAACFIERRRTLRHSRATRYAYARYAYHDDYAHVFFVTWNSAHATL